MATFEDIIKLAEADGGKFFVLGEDGEVRLVILPVSEYQELLLGKLKERVAKQALDIERVNQQILKAQLEDGQQAAPGPNVAVSSLGSGGAAGRQPVDLRQEVIDPSFDFEAPRLGGEDL